MKLQKFWVFLSTMLLLSLFVGGCVFSFPERHLRNFWADLDVPSRGAVLDLSETFLFANVYHPGRELSRLVFYANGRNIGETSTLEADAVDPRSYGEINWTPLAVGEYLLQVQADALEGPDVMSAPIRVCVIDFEIEGGTFNTNFGFEGPCDITTRDEFAVPGAITLAARATPDRLTYEDIFQEPPCPVVKDARLSFEATVEDPPDEVVFVVVYYSMTYSSGAPFYPGETSTNALVLTNTTIVEPSTEIYTGSTLDLSANLSNYFYGAGAGEIRWTARAIGRSGEILLEDGPHTIPARSSCGLIYPAIAPSPTATATLPANATLESLELNCTPDTYYAPVPNKCIEIQISTPKPEGDGNGDDGGSESGTPACSSYGNKDSCTTAGCSWSPEKSTCN